MTFAAGPRRIRLSRPFSGAQSAYDAGSGRLGGELATAPETSSAGDLVSVGQGESLRLSPDGVIAGHRYPSRRGRRSR